jgi:hypothetical protein
MAELFTTTLFSDTNLKAYYRFESGALTTDSTANAHTLTALSDPASTTGKWGGGVDFDSNDAYSAVDHADFQPTGNWSVGGWFKNPTANDVMLQSYSGAPNISGIQLYVDGTYKPNCISGRNTGNTINVDYKNIASTHAINDGNWHLVVVTWDGANLNMYVDNNTVETVAWANAPGYAGSNFVRIGCDSANTNFFAGQADDIFFFKGTALSAANVLTLYASGAGGSFLLNMV